MTLPTPFTPGQPVVFDTPEGIRFAQLCARKGALSLEIRGLKRRGRSAYSICKEAYGLKGSRKSVLAQLQVMVDNKLKEVRDRNANSNLDA